MDDDTPAPSELLADELIAACIGHLTLHSLPCVARVNRRWRAAALVAFDSQLRWRADPRCFPLRLPIPAAPARAESHVARAGACIAFLRDGDLVVQLVDPAADAVRTLRFAERRPVDGEGPPEPVEACRCELGEDGPFNAGVGGMVGYRREAEEEGMAFLPTTSRHGAAAASTKRVAVGSWQNVLHCGRCVFLLRALRVGQAHRSWWEDEAITADVLDLESGGVAAVDVTPLRDALEQQLSLPPAGVTFGRLDSKQLIRDEPVRCAVSAADGHFLFHASTQSGAKVAAALALPDHVAPQDGGPRGGRGGGAAAPAVSGGVVFARRWPSSHKIGSAVLLGEPRLSRPQTRSAAATPTRQVAPSHSTWCCCARGAASRRAGPSSDPPRAAATAASPPLFATAASAPSTMARRAAWSRRARCRAKGSRRPPCWSGTGGPACACRRRWMRCSSTLCPPRLHRQPCGRFASRLARRWRAAWARGPGSTAPSPTTTSRTERGEECTWCTSTEATRASCPSTTPTSCAASPEGRRSRGTSARRRWRWPRRRPSPSTRRAVGSRSACGTRARPQEWRTRSASGRGGGRSIKQSGGGGSVGGKGAGWCASTFLFVFER
ncbi:hypothetical protein EMIHUDRAFT_443137 [Emiliania huxleyi CCMP1516]|uniref:F-box domain-containing protein n=2 Tax=Emiliania huxleyi TaxID=2903 RepID=A0A0D3JVN5_EMIH1|nr:hypothetical protein EMIHUDRAFT_443137 [Emiliania huxleyi CCMP1516]EOD27570.1 hypothetical protein EMIHUDRAFT_443137 [Emiliania huxleyi CCMP1516]|eukprot:XP_005779999.1 hypothetical protein EMIHUDRAFT_443137 [Emiliania huxleyi CCMP1516]